MKGFFMINENFVHFIRLCKALIFLDKREFHEWFVSTKIYQFWHCRSLKASEHASNNILWACTAVFSEIIIQQNVMKMLMTFHFKIDVKQIIVKEIPFFFFSKTAWTIRCQIIQWIKNYIWMNEKWVTYMSICSKKNAIFWSTLLQIQSFNSFSIYMYIYLIDSNTKYANDM